MLLVYEHYIFCNSFRAGIDFRHQSLMKSKDGPRAESVNPLTAKLFNLNFHPLEVVYR